MKSFRYYLPATDLIFGKGSLESVGVEGKKFGTKVLVVTYKESVEKLDFPQKAIDSLVEEGLGVVYYGEVEPNPTVDIVDRGAEKAIGEDCDVVVGVGGGSAMDTAKNIAVVAGHFEGEKISIWEFSLAHEIPREITSKTLPVIAITSTSGTGSHVSRFAVTTNRRMKQKAGVMSPFICPRVSIVDVDILSCMPASLTAKTGFDVMAQLAECFVSKRSNPITDLYCLRGLELVFRYLPRAYEDGDDLEAREAMALADTYSGWALNTSRLVLPHALSHPVSAFYPEIAHGSALAAVTPESMRFNIEKRGEQTVAKYCQIARAGGKEIVSFDKKEALKSVEAVKELLEKTELTLTLRDLGVKEDTFEGMIDSAYATMRGPIEANPAPVTREDVLNLYRRSM